ncbi:hypothetical protein GTR00_21110, partial [Kineococcus sp. T90]|nr:hypothetical protein [Kineococcus indalonis]
MSAAGAPGAGAGGAVPVLRAAAAAALAVRTGRALTRWLPRHPPGGAARWERRNHRGDAVTLLEGPAAALAAAIERAPLTGARA